MTLRLGLRFEAAMLVGVVLLLCAVFAQSYNGRRDVVISQRHQCWRELQALVVIINETRIAQADNIGTSRARGVPPAVRRNKRHTIRRQERIIIVLDAIVDHRLWRGLDNRTDRARVRSNGVSCLKAYPAASPFQFFG